MVFVFDTNTLVSAILKPESVPAEALDMANKIGSIAFSEETRFEFLEVIAREKFDRYLEKNSRIVKAHKLMSKISLVPSDLNITIHCRDPKDIKFLSLVFTSKATCLITGDHDLLELHPFQGMPILKPSDFIKKFN